MNKKALSLSIDILTILIISILVFALGIYAVRHFIGTAEEFEQEISQSVERQMNQLFTSTTDKVILPEFRVQLKQGQRHSFALGIKNYLEQRAEFTVQMSFSGAVETKDKTAYHQSADMSKWIIEQQGPFTLNDNEQKIITLPVQAVGGEEGITYVFDATVSCNLATDLCSPYGYKQKIYVDVVD